MFMQDFCMYSILKLLFKQQQGLIAVCRIVAILSVVPAGSCGTLLRCLN
jgi:hypothetical protein